MARGALASVRLSEADLEFDSLLLSVQDALLIASFKLVSQVLAALVSVLNLLVVGVDRTRHVCKRFLSRVGDDLDL